MTNNDELVQKLGEYQEKISKAEGKPLSDNDFARKYLNISSTTLSRVRGGNYAGNMPPVLAWNPLAMRCARVDEGCRNCWHLRTCDRLAKNPTLTEAQRVAYEGKRPCMGVGTYIGKVNFGNAPKIIAVQFMGDTWHESVRQDYRDAIIGNCRKNPQHIFLMLTKRPERVNEEIPDNCWLGTSVSDQASADKRIPQLLKAKCKHRWLSIEPMLDYVSLTHLTTRNSPDGIGWVACGGETGGGARPCDPNWIAAVASRCEWNGIPFYDKRDPSCGGFTRREWPVEWVDKMKGVTR